MALTKIGATLGGSADVIQVTQSSHGLSLGFPVKVSGNGTYAHASADSATNAEAIGIIIATTTDTMTIALGGRITIDGVLPSGNLSAGTVLFLHTSAGKLTATEPSGNNEISKPMAVITYLNSEMIMVQQRGEVISTAGITLADDSVDSQHYAADSIDNEHLANDAVGADELAANAVVNASVASGAAIEFSKMENLTNSRLLVSDGSGDVSVSAVTAAEILQLSGLSANVTDTNLNALTDGSSTTSLHAHAGGGPSQAVEADIESQTNQDTYIPPDLLRHGPGVAKAWCRLTMSGQSFKVEYGMASISDAGVGVSDIVVDDAFTVGNTSFVVMSGGAMHVTTDQAATTSTTVRVNNRDTSHNSEDGGDIYVVYWGLI